MIRTMLPRLAPIALLSLTACKPDMTASPLIGTWQVEREFEDVDGIRAEPEINKEWAEADSKGVRFIETFASDGTWTVTATGLGAPAEASSTWTVLEDHSDRVAVRIAEISRKDVLFDRTFVFDSSDRMREVDGLSDAAWFTRVKVAK